MGSGRFEESRGQRAEAHSLARISQPDQEAPGLEQVMPEVGVPGHGRAQGASWEHGTQAGECTGVDAGRPAGTSTAHQGPLKARLSDPVPCVPSFWRLPGVLASWPVTHLQSQHLGLLSFV